MRAVTIPRFGGPDVLEVRASNDPDPQPGEVRVRIRAAGLNFAEVMARQGLYPDAPKPPMVVGYEGAGIVDAIGEGVETPVVGTRVIVMRRFGTHADTVCVPAAQTYPMPDAMGFEEGAAIPVNYLTAYQLLFRVGRIREGHRVLVHMAAGGVGTAVLQLCRTVPGVETFGTASSAKHPYVRDQGCAHPIDYHRVDYAAEVRRLTENRGVDLVLDPLGGKDWKKGYELLRPAGMLIAFGFANMNVGTRRNLLHVLRQLARVPRFTPMGLMSDNRAVAGVNMGRLFSELQWMREAMDALLDAYRSGHVRPHVDRVFSFEQAADAHRYLEEGKNVGKVVLVPS